MARDGRCGFSSNRAIDERPRARLIEFLAEPSRRRIRTLLEFGDKRRRDVRSLLDHAVRLDPRCRMHLTGGDAFSSNVVDLLQRRGAPSDCFVLSADPVLDGRDMPLHDALAAIMGRGRGAFVSCIPGRLGYYEYEDIKSSFLFSR